MRPDTWVPLPLLSRASSLVLLVLNADVAPSALPASLPSSLCLCTLPWRPVPVWMHLQVLHLGVSALGAPFSPSRPPHEAL